MRVVIDASIDPRLVGAFPDHHVQTLFDLAWQHLKDHVLVKQLDLTPGHVAGYGGRTGGRERRIMLKGEVP
jgi:hypothetical protein